MKMKVETKKLKKQAGALKGFAAFLLLLFLACTLLLYPAQIKAGVADSLLYCLQVLVPTLFPFIALNSYAVHSSASVFIGRLFGPVTRYLFRLPEAAASTLILSFIGGYPAGAAGISALLRQGRISQRQAGRMLLFCVNPGIAFVVSFVGGGLLRNGRIGLLLLISVTVSGLLLGILTAFTDKIPARDHTSDLPENTDTAQALIASAYDASKAMVKMCGAILLFAAVYIFLKEIGLFRLLAIGLSRLFSLPYTQAAALLSMGFEIAAGVGEASSLRAPAVLFAFGLAFSGFCVHFQVFSFFGSFPLSKGKFMLFRFLHGALSAFVFALLQRFFPQTTQVFYSTGQIVLDAGLHMPVAAGLSLLLMCAAFLLLSDKFGLRTARRRVILDTAPKRHTKPGGR